MRRLLAITLFLMLLTASEAAADVVLIMRRSAEPAGNYVRVCDIARVEGPAEQTREVGLTVIGPTPARGEELEITRWDIESRLYEMGITERVVFTGNELVRVVGSGTARGGGGVRGRIHRTRLQRAIARRQGSGNRFRSARLSGGA